MSGTRGATAVDVRIAGVLIWLRRGHKSNCRDVSEPVHEEPRELREAGLGAPSGEAPPPRSPPERHPHRRRQVLAVGRRSRSGAVVAAHLPEPVRLGELPVVEGAAAREQPRVARLEEFLGHVAEVVHQEHGQIEEDVVPATARALQSLNSALCLISNQGVQILFFTVHVRRGLLLGRDSSGFGARLPGLPRA